MSMAVDGSLEACFRDKKGFVDQPIIDFHCFLDAYIYYKFIQRGFGTGFLSVLYWPSPVFMLDYCQEKICNKNAAQSSGTNYQIPGPAPPILLGDPNCISLDCCVDFGSCRGHQPEVRSTERAGIYCQFGMDNGSTEKYSERNGVEGRGIVLPEGNALRHLYLIAKSCNHLFGKHQSGFIPGFHLRSSATIGKVIEFSGRG